MRSTSTRISPETYPIAATATALAYDFDSQQATAPVARTPGVLPEAKSGQQTLFSQPVGTPRVISFDSLTVPAEREAIRARAAEISRPAPVKTEKIEVRHARTRKARSADQGRLDFYGETEIAVAPPQSNIICDAPVAPNFCRFRAALIDTVLIVAGCALGIAMFRYVGGGLSFNKGTLPFLTGAFLTLPLFYKLLWTFAGRDTIGMRCAGLQLVDFDGNCPSRQRRYHRLFGSILSVLAAGMGMIWALVDEDGLTWHDHISGTFPTLVSEIVTSEE